MKASVATATRYDSVACDERNFSSSEERALALLGLSLPRSLACEPLAGRGFPSVRSFDAASSVQAESRTSLLDYAEAQPILALESDVWPHIASPGRDFKSGWPSPSCF